MTGLFRGRGMAKRTSGETKLEETQRETDRKERERERERERQREREKGKNCTEEKRREE